MVFKSSPRYSFRLMGSKKAEVRASNGGRTKRDAPERANDRVPSERIDRKRAERRERILETAVTAISASGPAEFSLNQLARDLDYTPGALYWYFPSKEAVVLAVQQRIFGELATMTAQVTLEAEARCREQKVSEKLAALHILLSQARFYLRLGETAPDHARIVSFSLDPRIWLRDEDAASLREVLIALFSEVTRAFVRAQKCGALREGNPIARSVQFWAVQQGLVQTAKLARIQPELFSPLAHGLDAVRTLLIGWGARPASLEAATDLLPSLTDASAESRT